MGIETRQTEDVSGFLMFSTSKIELEVKKGNKIEGSFGIEEQNGSDMEGYVYSSNFRMHVDTPQFSGSPVGIKYTFDTTGMNTGEVLKGNFYIISNKGEYVLPFVVMIQRNNLDSSMGSIKNLFHFTNLAKSNWDEAVEVFYNPEFKHIITGNDLKYRNLYQGLTVKGNRNINLEEFLIGIHKKQKIEYVIPSEPIQLNNVSQSTTVSLDISRNGWGYTLLNVKAFGDFIEVEKNRLVDEDFDGNVCHFNVVINPEKLHSGKNEGKLVFKHIYGSFEIDVRIHNSNFVSKSVAGHKKKSTSYALVRHYLDYTCKKINLNKWIMLSEELLSHRANIDDDSLTNYLMQVHLLLINERYNEAKFILDNKIRNRIDDADNTTYCYYLYMTVLYSNDDYYRREAIDQIKSIYDKDPVNWRIGWILLKMSEELNSNPSKKYAYAMDIIEKGCGSPIVYVEVLKALSEKPTILMHLDDKVMRVLMFGAREGVLSNDLMTQISYLALKAKTFSPVLLRIMEYIYKKNNSDDALQAICVQLMKGDRITRDYHEWFELAVERNLPLTKLYESFMCSMDIRKGEIIPRRVLMYFSYESNLPVAQSAYLYAYVYKNREKMPDMFEAYRDNMLEFVKKQLFAGKIDKYLAYLYAHICLGELYTPEIINEFAGMIATNCINVEDKDIINVVIIDERLKNEMVYPVIGKKAYVSILSNEHTILLEDAKGNRYYSSRDYNIERFFMAGKLQPKIDVYATENLIYDLFVCESAPEFLVITDQNVDRYMYLQNSEYISAQYKASLRLPLIRFYMEKDDERAVDTILNNTDYKDVSYKEYNEIIRNMLIRGMYDEAFEFVFYTGVDNIEPKILVRLAGRLIEREGDVENPKMTAMLVSAFERGKYDTIGLSYLVKYYRGPVKNLRNVWKAASEFYIDTYDICERMVLQTLATGAYIGEEAAILRQYVEGGAKLEVELGFLAYFAYEYFVNGRVVDEFVFEEIERIYRIEKTIEDVCMLAFLMYQEKPYFEGKLSDATKEVIVEFIRYLYTVKSIEMPFFASYADISVEAKYLSNHTMIEYRGSSENKAVINYIYSRDDQSSAGYCREDMIDMYGGIYVKSFLLFFGETLQYYITEEGPNGEELTLSGTVSKNDAVGESSSDRFSIVNDISIANTLKDYETAFNLLEEYKYKEYIVDSVFKPQ